MGYPCQRTVSKALKAGREHHVMSANERKPKPAGQGLREHQRSLCVLGSPDRARLQRRSQLQGFVEVFGEHCCRESVVSAVCSFDHFFEIFELQYWLHWSKNLQSITRRGGGSL